MKAAISEFVEGHRDDLLALLSDLVSARTENPPGNERVAADVLAACFETHGISYQVHEAEPGRTNIIGRVGAGKPRLLIACHLDVVPAGDGWQTDPFQAVVKDGWVYGRGVADNKGPAAAMLIAGGFLKAHEGALDGTVLLAGVADEECASTLGIGYLLREGLLDADMAIVPDILNHMQQIDVAEKGALFAEITSIGRQAHGSTPEQGVNAIVNMMELLQAIRQAKLPSQPHPLLTPPTVNIGTIEGGAAPNMVPARCTAKIDIRYLPGTEKEEILAALRDCASRVEAAHEGAQFQIATAAHVPPTEVSPDHELVDALRESASEMCDIEAEPAGISGATVVKQLLESGITAVGFGAGGFEQAHAANEYIEIAELLGLAKVLAMACVKICGRRPEA